MPKPINPEAEGGDAHLSKDLAGPHDLADAGPASSPIQIATAAEILAVIADRDSREFMRRVETKELSADSYDLNNLDYLVNDGVPVTRDVLGNQALVLTRAEFEQLGGLTLVLKNGETIGLDPDDFSGESLFIFPDDLG